MTTPPDTGDALKVCPHCDKTDVFVERADFSSCYVVCNDCGARGPTCCNENDDDCAAEDGGMEPGENAARRAWNRRTPAPSLDEVAEVLREFVYETTHLSPSRDDGSHDCRISAETLAKGRALLTRFKERQ